MKNSLNILIVEDELLIAEMLKEMLLELGHSVVAIAKSYAETQAYLNNSIDLAILDVNLNENKSGIDIGKEIKANYNFPFIYLTSYSDPTTIKNAISTSPESYLLKPFTKESIFATIEIMLAKNQDSTATTIIKDGHLNVKISSKNIEIIKSDRNYIEIITSDKKHLVRKSIETFLEELNSPNIVRIHRSYVVNINKVDAVNGQYVLINNKKYPLSRKYRDEVLKQFSNQ